jgi:Ca-activated chloride channel family protein
MVSRLAAQDQCSARDWAELARETISWGHRIQADDQEVPEGPIADGLAAVDRGAAADPALTPWDQLRSELVELRIKPASKPPPPQSPQNSPRSQTQPSFGEMHPQPVPPSLAQAGLPPPHRAPPPPNSSLAVPLQKLEQVKDGDSPLQLLKMIEDKEPKPPPRTAKDW